MGIYNDPLQGDCLLGNILFFPGKNVILINNHEHDGWEKETLKKKMKALLSTVESV